MTRQQFNPIAMVLVTVLIVTIKSFYFPHLSGEHQIYYLVLVAIATVVSCFEVIKFLFDHWQRRAAPPAAAQSKRVAQPRANLRDAYRLIYPPESRPILEVNRAQFNHPLEHELVIYDLSESGLGFHHDGLLPLSGTLLGRIRFSDGEYLEVAGDVVHHCDDRVGLALHCYIPHERFMKEQRMLITRHKPDRLNLEAMRPSVGGGRSGGRISLPELAGGCPCQRPKS